MKSGKKKTFLTVVIMLLVAAGVLYMYFDLSSNKKQKKETQSETEIVQKIIDKDLEKDYPATPRETVKLYNRIITCLYNYELTEEQIKGLEKQLRLLFDDELNDHNPLEDFQKNLRADIDDYHEKDMSIEDYTVEQGSAVSYYEKSKEQYALVLVAYILRDSKQHYKTNEQFVMRQDKSEHWRILGWQKVDKLDLDTH